MFLSLFASHAERQLNRIYSDPGRLRELIVNAANRVFRPKSRDNIRTSGLLEECKPGIALINDTCRKCPISAYDPSVCTEVLLFSPDTGNHIVRSVFTFSNFHMITLHLSGHQYITGKMRMPNVTTMYHITKTNITILKK